MHEVGTGGSGRYRWRTRLRQLLPLFLTERGVAGKGKRDCGAHEWYNAGDGIEHCYHCTVGVRPYDPAHFSEPS